MKGNTEKHPLHLIKKLKREYPKNFELIEEAKMHREERRVIDPYSFPLVLQVWLSILNYLLHIEKYYKFYCRKNFLTR
jgi:hypothetical protein